MHSQFKDQVIRKAGRSYLVLDRDAESPDWVWVRAIDPARGMERMSRDEIRTLLERPGQATGLER